MSDNNFDFDPSWDEDMRNFMAGVRDHLLAKHIQDQDAANHGPKSESVADWLLDASRGEGFSQEELKVFPSPLHTAYAQYPKK